MPMMKSRMEIGEQRDDSRVLCYCGHELQEHDQSDGLNGACQHHKEWSEACDCDRFERSQGDYDRREDEE